jgi:hypothetical protein
MAADIGTGTTCTFGTSVFAMNLTNVQLSGVERAAIKTTHLGTASNADTFVPGDLVDQGEIVLEGFFDPDAAVAIPIGGVAEVSTIDYGSGTDTHICSAFCTGFDITAPLEDMITFTARFKRTGAVT